MVQVPRIEIVDVEAIGLENVSRRVEDIGNGKQQANPCIVVEGKQVALEDEPLEQIPVPEQDSRQGNSDDGEEEFASVLDEEEQQDTTDDGELDLSPEEAISTLCYRAAMVLRIAPYGHTVNRRFDLIAEIMFPGVDTVSALRCYISIGDILLEKGEPGLALSIYDEALKECMVVDDVLGQAECLLRIGDSRRRGGDTVIARRMWERAKELFASQQKTEDVKKCDRRLDAFEGSCSMIQKGLGTSKVLGMTWEYSKMGTAMCSLIVV